MEYNRLINGKSELNGIVGIEPLDEIAEIFVQNKDGSINSVFVPNRYYILANQPLSSGFAELKGNLHFKYGVQFKDRKTFEKMRAIWRDQDIWSIYNAKESLQVKDGYTYYRGLDPKDVSVMSFDIESTGLDPNDENAYIVLISTTYRDKNTTRRKLFCCKDFEDQGILIDAFCEWIQECNPSIILGHNIIQFDLKYLQGIADKFNTRLLLGRDGSAIKFNSYESSFRVDGNRDLEYTNCYIYGREIIDTYFLSQKFDVSKSLESYGLKPIIKQLGLEEKDRVFYDTSQIRFNYKDPIELEKIIKYCVHDSDDAIKLWDKFGPLFFHMAPIIPKSFQDIIQTASGSQLNALMIRAYLQDAHSIPKTSPTKKFPGAISFAVPGIYSNTFKVDLESLYPSIILSYNVYDQDKDDKKYLLELVRIFKENRLKYKKLATETKDEYYSQMDATAKSILNSFYGFLAAPGLNFNSIECAEFITAKGREILDFTIKWASGKTANDFLSENL